MTPNPNPRGPRRIPGILGTTILLMLSSPAATSRAVDAAKPVSELIILQRFDSAEKTRTDKLTTWVLPEVTPSVPWNELVVSWNAAPSTRLSVFARTVSDTGASGWYNLGHWSTDPTQGARTSVSGQADAEGRVATDTLMLRVRRPRIQVKVEFPESSDPGGLSLIALSVLDSARTNAVTPPPEKRAWGKYLDVPLRSQVDFPEGIQSWCSPTSLSMGLAHWSKRLGIPALDLPVPTVAAAVKDPGWPGTGNWPFNTAFAGSLPGMHACVARLNSLREVEEWIAAGSPVITSVDANQLHTPARTGGPSGHLVVVRGFTASGDVELLDPGVAHERAARVIPRDTFDRAWSHSGRTAYLLWPAKGGGAIPPPRGSGGLTPLKAS